MTAQVEKVEKVEKVARSKNIKVLNTSKRPIYLSKGAIAPSENGIASTAELSAHYKTLKAV